MRVYSLPSKTTSAGIESYAGLERAPNLICYMHNPLFFHTDTCFVLPAQTSGEKDSRNEEERSICSSNFVMITLYNNILSPCIFYCYVYIQFNSCYKPIQTLHWPEWQKTEQLLGNLSCQPADQSQMGTKSWSSQNVWWWWGGGGGANEEPKSPHFLSTTGRERSSPRWCMPTSLEWWGLQ